MTWGFFSLLLLLWFSPLLILEIMIFLLLYSPLLNIVRLASTHKSTLGRKEGLKIWIIIISTVSVIFNWSKYHWGQISSKLAHNYENYALRGGGKGTETLKNEESFFSHTKNHFFKFGPNPLGWRAWVPSEEGTLGTLDFFGSSQSASLNLTSWVC